MCGARAKGRRARWGHIRARPTLAVRRQQPAREHAQVWQTEGSKMYDSGSGDSISAILAQAQDASTTAGIGSAGEQIAALGFNATRSASPPAKQAQPPPPGSDKHTARLGET